jgi:hypothetical protein
MKRFCWSSFVGLLVLPSCSSVERSCEDITQIKAQLQACQILQRQINQAKEKPLLHTELVRRYQQDCVDIRYYRDDKQHAICGNKAEIEKIRKAIEQ